MSFFYGKVNGGRGTACRCGHREITATANTWDFGIGVRGVRGPDGKATFHIYRTCGSNAASSPERLLTVTEDRVERGDRE